MDTITGDKRFEWRGEDLFVVMEHMHEDACWLKADLMEEIRAAAPDTDADATVYIIERDEKGDKIHKAIEVVTFIGGDVLCYLDPEAITAH
jgi:hypothetical protein